MKKQFYRVKQLADQAFLKAEKSEVLNHEELQIADQKVEVLRSALVSINKKLCPNGPINDKEKRLKKCLEYQLGATFVEEAREEKDCLLLQHILKISGNAEHDLAKEFAEHESKVEEMVFSPLQKVIDNELPSILKQKHNLKKYCLDKDSASNRYHATKKETLKEDMEEADSKVEQSRDALAIEMYNVIARENEFSSYILQLLKLQRGYHESALKNLENVIPQLERTIGDSRVKKVFGIPLQEHLRVTGKRLAYPLEVCIKSLSTDYGLSEEGLFRIAGGLSKVKRLKAAIDCGCFSVLIPEYRDVHVLASTLKSYLRELPEPLLTYHLHKEWMQSMQCPESQRVEVVKHLLNKLPQENRDNLAYLIQFLARLADHPENKMSSSNLAIVMAPNLLWNKNEELNVNMGNTVTINMLVELLIKEVNTFFPIDVSGLVTIGSLIPEEEYGRNGNNVENVDATSTESLIDSPKPNSRKKKPAAPGPPTNNMSKSIHEAEQIYEKINTSTYPSGSATLTRPPKPKEPKVKSTIGVNTEENDLSLSRKRSFSKDDQVAPKSDLVNSDTTTKVVTSLVSKAPSVIEEKNFKTTATHQVVSGDGSSSPKPIAAPRQSLASDEKSSGLSRNSSLRSSADLGDVQLRRPEVELRAKPEIPARPATLAPAKRSSMDIDPTLQKTQCSVYSVAHKQQPSIVNIQNRTEKIQLGHDVMMSEKEKFLGHSPRLLENKFNDINSNKKSRPTSIEPAQEFPLNPSKSSEKLNELNENRQKHTRTRSDGNIIDVDFLLHTPPSPRSLNKPTEPPPPPPVKKAPPESTDF